MASMSTLFLYLKDRRKTAGLFPPLSSECVIAQECTSSWKIDLADDESFGWKLLYDTHMTDEPFFLVTQRRWGTSESGTYILPGNPRFRPSSHSAVQLDCLALPDSLSTGLDNKLWRVHQAVWVHFPTELCPLLHLQQESKARLSYKAHSCERFI